MEMDLAQFLENEGLSHLLEFMLVEGVTVEILLQANDGELSELCRSANTKFADKMRLRSALEKIKQQKVDPGSPVQAKSTYINQPEPSKSKLTSDFETVYPTANNTYEQKFPLVKLKLLKLLADKAGSNKSEDTIVELLDLAFAGEEQANVAALLGIVFAPADAHCDGPEKKTLVAHQR